MAGEEAAKKYQNLIFLAGSASAEFFADIALCPFEAVKVGGREGGQLLCVAWGMMECSPAVAGRWLAFWKPPMVVAAALSGRRRSGSGISSMCRALTSTCLPPLSPALGCLPALPAGQGADGARVCQGHGRRPAQVHCPGGRGRAVEGHHPAVGPPDPLHNDEVR